MPKTSLFESELVITREYLETVCGIEDVIEADKDDIIKPGMAFLMNYTHTRNYASEDACVNVTVESIRTTVYNEQADAIFIIGCVLRPEKTIFVCESGAMLARGISLHTAETTIATGSVKKIMSA